MIDVERVIDVAAGELRRLKDCDIALKIPVVNAIQLVSQLQLALRHPENCGDSARIGREICDAVILILEHHSRELANFCRLGFDPKYDQRDAGPISASPRKGK